MSKYDNFLIICNFNSEIETEMSNFCDMYHQHNLVKDSPSYKNANSAMY